MAERDRFSIENYIYENVIPMIDNKKFLGLGKGKSEKDTANRSELFFFAMALGIRKGERRPLSTTHGFIQDTAIPGVGDIYGVSNAMSLIYSVALSELRKDGNEDKINDLEEARKIAQEYANTGFHLIEDWLNDKNLDEETIMFRLIGEMNRATAAFTEVTE